MKKILVITPFFYPHVGGSEKYLEGLYSFLKKKNPQISIDVLCYNTDNAKEKEVYKGLNILRIPCWQILPGQFCIVKPSQLFKFYRQNWKTYDLIHCSTRFFDSSWWGPVFARVTGKKIILTDHCAYHPVHLNPLIKWIAKFIDLAVSGIFLHFFDRIFVESKETQRFLKEVFDIDSKVAYPGINPSKVFHKPNNKRLKVIYVGRLIESKGVKNLFNIAKRTSVADFVLAGPGPLVKKFRDETKRGKIKNISVPGQLTEKEVSKLLEKSDIFAYPTLHSEGLPMALLEAGSKGLAVIANDIGGIREVIVTSYSGILINHNDLPSFRVALEKLIKDKKLQYFLGKNLQKTILKNFTWKSPAKLIIDEI